MLRLGLLLWFCRAGAAWITTQKELRPEVSELIDSYAKWHAESATQQGTKVLVYVPMNGVGDQLVNILSDFVHYCLLSSPRVRFEMAPSERAKDVGVWSAGLDPRIDVRHDEGRAEKYGHEVLIKTHLSCADHDGCAYINRSRSITPYEAVWGLLLRPSANVLRILNENLPSARPAYMVGLHMRTYAIEGRVDQQLGLEVSSGPTRQLYHRLASHAVEQVVQALRKKQKELEMEDGRLAAFLASDFAPLTPKLKHLLEKRLPGVGVAVVPGTPVHSSSDSDPWARQEDYEVVWATWFALQQADHLIIGPSMFSSSVVQMRPAGPPEVDYYLSCRRGWTLLKSYHIAVKNRGKPRSLQTLAEAALELKSEESMQEVCFPPELRDAISKLEASKLAEKSEL